MILDYDQFTILGSDQFGTLYSVYIPMVDQNLSVYVDNNDMEYYTKDMQGPQPMSIEEMADFEYMPYDYFIVNDL